MALDPTDERIIAALAKDARVAYGTIGALVGLSASAVKRRVDRLIATGAIQGFTIAVDPRRVGAIEAFVELSCEAKVSVARLRSMIADVPEVRAGYTVTGDADAVLHVVALDITDFERVLERLRDNSGVSQTRSTIVLTRL